MTYSINWPITVRSAVPEIIFSPVLVGRPPSDCKMCGLGLGLELLFLDLVSIALLSVFVLGLVQARLSTIENIALCGNAMARDGTV